MLHTRTSVWYLQYVLVVAELIKPLIRNNGQNIPFSKCISRPAFLIYIFEPHSWRGVLIQHYVIKFVSDLWQFCGFFWVRRFPPPIKRAATI